MRIMVFDVPAESGGALSVLHEFYDEYNLDKNNEYIFVVSLAKLNETTNIKTLMYPWIKKSWIHRFYFDHLIAPTLIKKYKVDRVLSLQNVIIPHSKIYQSVYVHNAIPFSNCRFSLIESISLWVYQNIIGRIIVKSVCNANRVIVQTKWMADMMVEKYNININMVEVKLPKVKIEAIKFFEQNKRNHFTFFYPANGAIFKNHKVIVDACLKLKEEGINNYNVIFTLIGNENKHIKKLYKLVSLNGLPIDFIGSLEKNKVFDMYSKSILLFPSYIETVGLPLIEAKMHQSPIIASNCEFTHEILDSYEKVKYFNPFDDHSLKSCLMTVIKN